MIGKTMPDFQITTFKTVTVVIEAATPIRKLRDPDPLHKSTLG
jgi:hypothetical protein